MKKTIVYLFVFAFIFTSCSTHKKIEPDDEFAVEADMGKGAEKNASLEGGDLSLDDLGGASAVSDKKDKTDDNLDVNLENELDSLDNTSAQKSAEPAQNELTLDEPAQQTIAQQPAPPKQEVSSTPQPTVPDEAPTKEPVVQEALPQPEPPVAEPEPVKIALIDNVVYKANSNGGTVAISADRPLKFTTRLNSITNQFIVEVENSTIPKKLKRSLNTKDMASSIGSVDIYQKEGSSIARFVVQLRPGSSEPIIQPEGNSLLIIGAGVAAAEVAPQGTKVSEASPQDLRSSAIDGQSLAPSAEIVDLASSGIMSSDDLEEFLISNNKFYGKKLSIETNKMDIKDAIKFIAEESGVNIIIDESVAGFVSLKLRSVPWDQALILLLKSKRLGFKRQGSVLRIGKTDEFKKEEEDAIEMKESRKAKSPSVVKRFFIGYADIDDLEKKIEKYLESIATVQFLAESAEAAVPGQNAAAATSATEAKAKAKAKASIGTVLADKRTNSIIVTDTEENMVKITKLIEAIDTQPQQVLIEGKVVEAKEEFIRGVGVNWSSTPAATTAANAPVNSGRIGINPILDAGAVVLDSSLTWGQLDILGSLTAKLQLGEREDKVRVLSSPRIAVLSNEQASISQTVGLLIPTSVSTGTGTGTTTTTNQIVPVGVALNVTPLVSNEGTVTLNLDIKRSFLARVDSQTPEERNAKTKVIVKSGQTAVIGGIFESETRQGNSGVPGFKDLPVLGRLFQSEKEAKSKNELVIFVTPTILKPVIGAEKISTDIK